MRAFVRCTQSLAEECLAMSLDVDHECESQTTATECPKVANVSILLASGSHLSCFLRAYGLIPHQLRAGVTHARIQYKLSFSLHQYWAVAKPVVETTTCVDQTLFLGSNTTCTILGQFSPTPTCNAGFEHIFRLELLDLNPQAHACNSRNL